MIPTELVLEALGVLSASSLICIVDGGWGIDALIGQATREHDDLDLAVERSRLPVAITALANLSFSHDSSANPGLPARVVLKDRHGREIDLHPLVFDDAGDGWQELTDRAWGVYPAEGNDATGAIQGVAVRCLTPELQLRHHLGYPWGEADMHDMRLLQKHFGLRLPPPFEGGSDDVPPLRLA